MASTDGGEVQHAELHEIAIDKQRGSLASRITWVAIISAVVAAAISLSVAYPLVQNAARVQARETLARQADTVALLFDRDDLRGPTSDSQTDITPPADPDDSETAPPSGVPDPHSGTDHHPHVDDPMQSAEVIVVTPLTQTSSLLTTEDVYAVTHGFDFSAERRVGLSSYFLEGRAVSANLGIVLRQRDSVADGPAGVLIQRMAVALAIGLALAIAIGLLVARRTAKPLREAADAALKLAEGRRDVDVQVRGAREVADIGLALNKLSTALAHSEDRQREFLMSVSHELRTPMTSIKGYAEALADGVISGTDVTGTGEILLAEGQRLDRLVSDLLDLARSEAVDFRLDINQTDIAEILRQAAGAWQLRCQKEGLTFSTNFAADLAFVDVDQTRVRQIIDNLIENAVRVTPSPGVISLSSGIHAESVWFAVDDTGPGLTDDDIEVAFQPSVLNARYRQKRAVGTGLGLALVGRLAERMGGTARASHSALGGARFEVGFPLSIRG